MAACRILAVKKDEENKQDPIYQFRFGQFGHILCLRGCLTAFQQPPALRDAYDNETISSDIQARLRSQGTGLCTWLSRSTRHGASIVDVIWCFKLLHVVLFWWKSVDVACSNRFGSCICLRYGTRYQRFLELLEFRHWHQTLFNFCLWPVFLVYIYIGPVFVLLRGRWEKVVLVESEVAQVGITKTQSDWWSCECRIMLDWWLMTFQQIIPNGSKVYESRYHTIFVLGIRYIYMMHYGSGEKTMSLFLQIWYQGVATMQNSFATTHRHWQFLYHRD